MKWFQDYVGRWGDQTFGESTQDSVVAHLCEEVIELAESHDPAEAADCFILLCQHAHKGGYDILQEARKKMEINRRRSWREPDENGVVRHVEETA